MTTTTTTITAIITMSRRVAGSTPGTASSRSKSSKMVCRRAGACARCRGTARLSLGHGGHTHDYELDFAEHGHGHPDESSTGLKVGHDGAYMDAHERAHAADITRRFGGRNVTTGQILLFGLTGGLIPCPA